MGSELEIALQLHGVKVYVLSQCGRFSGSSYGKLYMHVLNIKLYIHILNIKLKPYN